MMRYLAWILCFLLIGCSSGIEKSYYQLPTTPSLVTKKSDLLTQKQLWVQTVQLSGILAANGITYQTSDVNYVNANNHLWASPLEQQLMQNLVNQLSIMLPNRLVSAQPLENRPDSLNVFLTAFHGRYDGKVIIQGNWIYKSDKVIIKRDFSLLLDQDENGYSALVRTLARGWTQVGQSIASQLS
ncbi:membrane integrity-associated transporter subunit PqiC [Candidatus Arsenophonus nilaparvatae]|uniref:membrane integrity-associated transporter subunit PqiC n=1 Tax=Candidatus Arsenophonus nilaparvatae TaxID=1247023 RepID=UPI0016516958|nr:membrane integrity-associated transporter subunit PqiC [Candidatus Arsenophonus nilaparvatae]